MKRALIAGGAALSLLFAGGACKKSSTTTSGTTTGTGPAVEAPKAPDLLPIGMLDPFARLANNEVAKALKAGYAAQRAKKYDDAQAAFHKVVEASPDYTSARFQEVKAAALAGRFADVPALWAQLLARDHVAYAGRLDKLKELAALRAAPEWAQVKAAETSYQPAYAAGLDKGIFFVARLRDAAPIKSAGDSVPVAPNQEAFHWDPATKVYRRLTETDGHVYAINVSTDRKLLSILVVKKAAAENGAFTISDPLVSYVDLGTLATVGPFPLKGAFTTIALFFSARGEPLWSADGTTWAVDAARTTLVKAADALDAATPNVTWASMNAVNHGDRKSGGAKVSGDGTALEIDGVDKPVRAARPIAESTLEWSPDRKRLAYAGTVDACKVLATGKAAKEDRNELFLFDMEKKTASRIAQAVSAFDSLWLDADHLVYEGGVGKDGKLHVYEVSTRSDTVLKARSGAGLFGYPELVCEHEGEGEEEAAEPDEPATPPGE